MKDNQKLKQLFTADQKDRKNSNWERDWLTISFRDIERRKSVLALIGNKQLKTSSDYYRAALIFQHGNTVKDFKKASDLAQKAMESGLDEAKWLYAATTDRLLMNLKKKQRFGTQYIQITSQTASGSLKQKWILYPYDKRTTDTMRKIYNVPTLKELLRNIPHS